MGITKEKQSSCTTNDPKCKCMAEQQKKSKMKVLKKIKQRIGLGSSKVEKCSGQNNLPPLRFHHIHGENIRISRNGTLAKRFEAFNKGITFSDRPVNPNERVYINIAETTTNWSGFIRFGFTVIDPETFYDPSTSCCTLPKHACPDLTNRHGFWAKALSERYCERANILTFYFTTSGDVHFGINGEDKGVFFKIPPTNDPLWLLFDVYGNCSAIEYINQRGQQNRIGSRLSLPAVASEDEVDGIAPQMQSMSVHEINRPLPDLPRSRSIASLRPSFAPLLFHRTRGQNIHLSEDKFIATRVDSELSQGYVFTARPVRIGERLIIQILRTEPNSVGGLTLGLTACDPSNLRPCDLPNDAEALLDRPEYWVVSKNIVSNLVRGDQIIFSITANGEVYISRNNGPATAIMQVDHDIQLWAFLDIFGSMQSIRVVSQMAQTTLRQASVSTAVLPTQRPVMRPYASQYLRQAEPIALRPSESVGNIGMNMTHMGQSTQSFSIPTTSASNGHFNRAISNNDMIQLKSGTATVLVVNIPPSGSSSDISVTSQMHQAQSTQMLVPAPVASPSRSKQTINQLQTTPTKSASPMKRRPLSQWQDGQTECAICCENPIDSALYSCGHMCMCYECAQEQWHGAGDGQCPLCRAVIRDVIRIYKS